MNQETLVKLVGSDDYVDWWCVELKDCCCSQCGEDSDLDEISRALQDDEPVVLMRKEGEEREDEGGWEVAEWYGDEKRIIKTLPLCGWNGKYTYWYIRIDRADWELARSIHDSS